MRSFKIMQLLHANETTKTEALEEKSLIEMPNNISRALAMYTDTLTGPDGEVYQISSDALNELSEIMSNLAHFNFSEGGVCLPPTVNLYNQTNCLDRNSSDPQQYNTILFLDACNYNSSITLNSSVLLGAFSAFCSLASIPSNDDEDSYLQELFVALIYLTALLLGVAAGVYVSSKLCDRRDNQNWLDERYSDSVNRSNVMIQDVTATGGEDDAKRLELASADDVGSAELHDGNTSGRNRSGYSRLG
jgi:hypothetical protein